MSKIIARSILYVVLIVTCFLIIQYKNSNINIENQKITDYQIAQEKINNYLEWKHELALTYGSLPIEANEVIVYDTNSKKTLFQKNNTTLHTLASVTKLMTTYLALQTLDASSSITISKKALNTEGESGLIEGEVWPLEKLVAFTLIVSSNDGAAALAEAVEQKIGKNFIQFMNEKAIEMNLPSLHFTTPSGLDTGINSSSSKATSGGIGNAQDITKLAEIFLYTYPNIAIQSTYQKATFIGSKGLHEAVNTDVIISYIKDPLLSKTGYTELAGGNLVYAFNAGTTDKPRPVIVTILNSSTGGRFSDARMIASSTLTVLRKEPQSI